MLFDACYRYILKAPIQEPAVAKLFVVAVPDSDGKGGNDERKTDGVEGPDQLGTCHLPYMA